LLVSAAAAWHGMAGGRRVEGAVRGGGI
jgi:hypothetical protein